jgi:peptide deformylase
MASPRRLTKLPEIVEAGDPVLHEVASPVPVEEIPTERIQKIIDDMIAVMRAAPGVGLAATQIGIPLQVRTSSQNLPWFVVLLSVSTFSLA